MRALLSTASGGPETLVMGELPEPTAGPGQVVVAVKACSINFPDTLMIVDLYQFKPERPFAPGGEIAGTVEAIGEGVTGFAIGDRVIGLCGNGGLTEKVAVAAFNCFKMPDAMSFDDGAALLMTYGTSIHALKDRGHMKSGDNVLVLGGDQAFPTETIDGHVVAVTGQIRDILEAMCGIRKQLLGNTAPNDARAAHPVFFRQANSETQRRRKSRCANTTRSPTDNK